MANEKNLIPLTQRSSEEAFAIRSAGGKASQQKRRLATQQKYLLGKYAGLPIVDKRTAKKFENMGFNDDEINRALEITHAIMEGARKGNPRMIEIYLRLMGETEQSNNSDIIEKLDEVIKGIDDIAK